MEKVHAIERELYGEIVQIKKARLVQHNIKINLQKCFFGSKEVSYLGFRLTEQGILPGTDTKN